MGKGETERVGLVLDPKGSNLNWIQSNVLGLFTLDQGVLGLENEGKKLQNQKQNATIERLNENNGPRGYLELLAASTSLTKTLQRRQWQESSKIL